MKRDKDKELLLQPGQGQRTASTTRVLVNESCVWEWLVYLLNVSVCIWTLELVIPESTLL